MKIFIPGQLRKKCLGKMAVTLTRNPAEGFLVSQADRPRLRPLPSRFPTIRGVSPPTSTGASSRSRGRFDNAAFRSNAPRFGKPHRSDFFRSLHMAIAACDFFLFSCQGSFEEVFSPCGHIIPWQYGNFTEKKLRGQSGKKKTKNCRILLRQWVMGFPAGSGSGIWPPGGYRLCCFRVFW